MQVIRDPAETANIADPELRHLIQKTIAALSPDGPYNADELGYFLIVEPGDTLATINAKIGFDILANRWTGKRFDQPGYTPSFELVEEHAGYYEMVFVISDSGYGVEVFVPKPASTTGTQGSEADTQGNAVDADLLAMCAKYATPAGPALAG